MNWFDRIKEAKERGEFTEQDQNDSGNWVTCACGEQDKALQANGPNDGGPGDDKLFDLGIEFNVMVVTNEFDQAFNILTHIERRAAFLLAKNADVAYLSRSI